MQHSRITLCAKDLGLTDLDEYSPCFKFSQVVKDAAVPNHISGIHLDLEHCWVEYSFTHLFLDEALIQLQKTACRPRQLEISVSINLGAPQFMAALLFRLSKLVNPTSEGQPESILAKLEEFCKINEIEVMIVSKIVVDSGSPAVAQEFRIPKRIS